MVEQRSVRDDGVLDNAGAVCAVALGVTTALVGLFYLLLPEEQRAQARAAELFPSFLDDGTVLRLELLALALTGVFGLAVVPYVSRLAGLRDNGWVRWTGNLALLGFAVTAVSNFRSLNRIPVVADTFEAGDEATRAAIAPLWRATLDPDGILGFGAVGLWVVVVRVLALQRGREPRALWLLGLVLGAAYLLVPVAQIFDVASLVTFAAVVGVVGGLAWYGWAGVVSIRGRASASNTIG